MLMKIKKILVVAISVTSFGVNSFELSLVGKYDNNLSEIVSLPEDSGLDGSIITGFNGSGDPIYYTFTQRNESDSFKSDSKVYEYSANDDSFSVIEEIKDVNIYSTSLVMNIVDFPISLGNKLYFPDLNSQELSYNLYENESLTKLPGIMILDSSEGQLLKAVDFNNSREADVYLVDDGVETQIPIKVTDGMGILPIMKLGNGYVVFLEGQKSDQGSHIGFDIVVHDYNENKEIYRGETLKAFPSFKLHRKTDTLIYPRSNGVIKVELPAGIEQVTDIPFASEGLNTYDFSEDGKFLLTGFGNGTNELPIIDLETGEAYLIETVDSKITRGMFSPDDRRIYVQYGSPGDQEKLSYFVRSFPFHAAASALSVKVAPEKSALDPYTNPISSIDIVTNGELFAADVSCTVAGPMDITSADYGNWGGSERLTLPLQWTSKGAKGVVSLKGDVDSVSGEQQLLVLDTLAEVTTADITVNCAVTVSDKNGNQLNVNLIPATIRLDDGIHGGSGVITGQVTLPAGVNSEDVTVEVTINGRTIRLNVDENGRFEFDELRDGDFTINVKSEHYTQSCINTQTTGSQIDLGNIELIAGDVNNDGEINIADFTYLAGRYGSAKGDDRYTTQADLNSDEKVNIQDLAILGSHFGSRQCNP